MTATAGYLRNRTKPHASPPRRPRSSWGLSRRDEVELAENVARDSLGREPEMDDPVGEGNLGLIRVAEESDPQRILAHVLREGGTR